MKLGKKQIDRIYQKDNVVLPDGKTLVWINVPRKGWSVEERNFNIYCIDDDYNIIWQVTEPDSEPYHVEGEDPDDPFCYIGQTETGEFIAGRFTGFVYSINPETGVATQTGFQK